MIQCQNPVEWVVDWPLAWLLTYSGSDCDLWRTVYRKCLESELCRRIIEMLPTIGYSLAKHKCFVEDLDDLNDAEPRFLETPQPTNQPKHPNHPNPQNCPSKHYSNTQKPKSLCRLDAYALLSLKTTPPFSLSSTPPT